MPIAIKALGGETLRAQSWTMEPHHEFGAVILIIESEDGNQQADLTPEAAEFFAAKLLHSAGVARQMSRVGGRSISMGPKGREKLARRAEDWLAIHFGSVRDAEEALKRIRAAEKPKRFAASLIEMEA